MIFDLKKAFAIDPYQNSGFADLVEDVYSYFKLLGEGTSILKDLEEYDVGVKRYVTQVTAADQISNYDFPSGQWGTSYKLPFPVVQTSTVIPASTTAGYYLIQSTGQVAQYQPQTGRVSVLTSKWDFSNQKVISYNDEVLLLKANGEIRSVSGSAEKPWSMAQNLGAISDLVSFPVYDGFNVVIE